MNTVEKKSWNEFRETGLLWFVNSILHAFGWAIVAEYAGPDDEKPTAVYPAKVLFRGFDEEINTEGYRKLHQTMADVGKEEFPQ